MHSEPQTKWLNKLYRHSIRELTSCERTIHNTCCTRALRTMQMQATYVRLCFLIFWTRQCLFLITWGSALMFKFAKQTHVDQNISGRWWYSQWLFTRGISMSFCHRHAMSWCLTLLWPDVSSRRKPALDESMCLLGIYCINSYVYIGSSDDGHAATQAHVQNRLEIQHISILMISLTLMICSPILGSRNDRTTWINHLIVYLK